MLVFDWNVAVGCDSWSHRHPPQCDVHESFQGSTKKGRFDCSCKDFWTFEQLMLLPSSSGQRFQIAQSSCKSRRLDLIGFASVAK